MAVRVLIVDDSPTARLALARALSEDASDIVIVGEAANAKEALAAIDRLSPDLVTMDVHLGAEDGIQLAAQIMGHHPVPILIVTGVDARNPGLAFRAMQAGALDVVPKLPGPHHPAYAGERQRLRRLTRALAIVPVATRHRPPPRPMTTSPPMPHGRCEVVLIGASTGGPLALQALLASLERPFPLPIAIVQHVSEGFGEMLGTWLATTTGHRVFTAKSRHVPQPGDVILAPDNAHLVVPGRGLLAVREGPPRNFQRPCIDLLFETAAPAYGAHVTALLLTGMGRDGTAGLRALRDAGARTFAQDPSTCVVDSMPQSAISLGAATAVMSIDHMASALTVLARA